MIVDEPLGTVDVYEAQPDLAKTYRIRLTRAPAPGENVTVAVKAENTITGFNDARGFREARPQVGAAFLPPPLPPAPRAPSL